MRIWISNTVDARDTATAIGAYSALQGILSLVSSSIAGLIWYAIHPQAMFLFSGIGSAIVVLYLLLGTDSSARTNDPGGPVRA